VTKTDCDVLVAGAGVAGLAAGILLARDGMRVRCIDPEPFPRRRVGESLDWSAPELLEGLGFSVEELVADGIGTFKRELHGIPIAGGLLVGRPPDWIAKWPLSLRVRTAHFDRERLDPLLYQAALEAGVVFEWDRVAALDVEGERVAGCRTRSGRRFAGTWFIDASGRARLMARAAGIEKVRYGVPKVAVWTVLAGSHAVDGTVLYLDDVSDYLRWAWEIPVAIDRKSVGVVIPAADFRARRAFGESPGGILVAELSRHPRFHGISPAGAGPVETRGYHCYVHRRVSGPNWMLAGEAAAFVDPITSVGVSAALRHAFEAAEIIEGAGGSPAKAASGLKRYDRRVRDIADLYNAGIDSLFYRSPVRRAFGLRWASRAYVTLGFGMNSFYTRIHRSTRTRDLAVLALAGLFRVWVRGWVAAARRRAGREVHAGG
jgi:flavin-dependent dehydrogenase